MNMIYFNQLGYKVADSSHETYIIKDFQRHAGIAADGLIGPITKSKMAYYNKNNYCPEVFQPIKGYKPYTDIQIESLCNKGLVGLGSMFNYYSKLNDFDVIHNVAHAILESKSGTFSIAVNKKNLYGWAAYDNSAYNSAYGFTSKSDCIREWSKWFNTTYLLPTGKYYCGNNEYCVTVFYCSSSIAGINKSFLVQQMRKKLNGI